MEDYALRLAHVNGGLGVVGGLHAACDWHWQLGGVAAHAPHACVCPACQQRSSKEHNNLQEILGRSYVDLISSSSRPGGLTVCLPPTVSTGAPPLVSPQGGETRGGRACAA